MTAPKPPVPDSKPLKPTLDPTLDGNALDDINEQGVSKRTAEQNAQARLVLIQLLWLAVFLMVMAMVWLGYNQRQLALRVEERLAVIETFTTRINNIDDRLFALSPTTQQPTQTIAAHNDTPLVTVQLTSADRLYQDGDYQASDEMLKLVRWQLGSERLALAAPLKAALQVAIDEDINHITAMQNQIDPWQADVIKMREVQSYLRGLPQDSTISQRQLVYHDATMLLSLAIGAGVMRERETVVVYLSECIQKLERLQQLDKLAHIATNTDTANTPNTDTTNHPQDGTVDSLQTAIFTLNTILANPPKLHPLKSLEIVRSE